MLLVVHAWERGVNQLVRHHPVVVEFLLGGVLAHPHPREGGKSADAAPSCAVPHSAAGGKLHQDAVSWNRKFAVVDGDRFGGILNPLHNSIWREIGRARAEVNLD